jgi:AcrR family transcriptional regulator
MDAMPTTSTRRRAAHLGPERRRPQVLDAALAIAVRSGIGAVTIQSVAAEMGVTRPVVYACFADRIDVVDALLEREGARLEASVLAALRGTGGLAPEQAFIKGFQALLSSASEHADAWNLLLAGEPGPALSERFRKARDEVREHASAWIAPAMETWWQTPDLDAKLPVLIELFMSACESAIRSFLASTNTWDADRLGEFVGRAVFRAFRDA